ncbi:MAG: NADH-quinone oxidoreductase subunit L [Frankiaceae bacterium]
MTHQLLAADAVRYLDGPGVFNLVWLLVALPLAGAAVLLLSGRRIGRWGPVVGTMASALSFLWAIVLFVALLGHDSSDRSFVNTMFTWVPVNGFHVPAQLLIDPLSACFMLLITGVGTLIHVYSIGYMEHDPKRQRFFGFLNLFIAAMLLLVLGANYLVLFVGWEGVGLASYLLIGFWHYKPSAATAAKKAFVVNRVGDVGLSLAIMLMFATFGSISFAGVFNAVGGARSGTVTAIGLLLLAGACGKSAQIPLQSWLIDAMEGPTPVSALIHAATMVTAGVYLIARSSPIFNASPTALLAVACVGTATLLYGAVIGCALDDIKKVLAGSTISQIGYMVLGVGLGTAGYSWGILHLLAHGFFKAVLFLGAGSVMHAMRDNVDMRRYGGLRKYMPVTFWTFAMGYLALIGFPGFSGFFTKDKIIEAAFGKGGAIDLTFGAVALGVVVLTSFYMTRLMLMTFFGEPRWEEGVHPHESPATMTVPMIVLSIGSVVFGALFVYVWPLADWLEPTLGKPVESINPALSAATLSILGFLSMLGGAVAAWALYGRRKVPVVAPAGSPATVAARKGLYADAVNEAVLMRPGQYLTRAMVFFDGRGLDGAVNGLAAFLGGTSGRTRRLQTGFVRSYAMSILGGAVVMVATLLVVRL